MARTQIGPRLLHLSSKITATAGKITATAGEFAAAGDIPSSIERDRRKNVTGALLRRFLCRPAFPLARPGQGDGGRDQGVRPEVRSATLPPRRSRRRKLLLQGARRLRMAYCCDRHAPPRAVDHRRRRHDRRRRRRDALDACLCARATPFAREIEVVGRAPLQFAQGLRRRPHTVASRSTSATKSSCAPPSTSSRRSDQAPSFSAS